MATRTGALLDAIIAAPADDAPRRVYADALLDLGEPLGELIHIQLDLATGGLTREEGIVRRRRERELFRQHGARWTAPLAGLADAPTFRRGFVDEAVVNVEVLSSRSGELFERAPVLRALVLDGLTGYVDYSGSPSRTADPPEAVLGRLAAAFAAPCMERVEGLYFRASCETEHDLEFNPLRTRMLTSEALPIVLDAAAQLPRLNALSMGALNVDGARALAASGLLARLERLDLDGSRDGTRNDVVRIVLGAVPAQQLRSLAVGELDFGNAIAVLSHPRIADLDRLSVCMPPLLTRQAGDEAAAAMHLPTLAGLRHLECDARDQPLVIRAIASSPALANLVELDVVADQALSELATATRLDALRVLRTCPSTEAIVYELFDWPFTRRLELVDLRRSSGTRNVRGELQELFDGVVLVRERAVVAFERSVYGWSSPWPGRRVAGEY